MKLWGIYFEPEDWIGFREVRSFSFSDRVESVFPTSFPFYGAVRTALMRRGKDFDPGDSERAGTIRMFGPFIFENTSGGKKIYFPIPKNVYRVGDEYRTMPLLETEEGFLPWKPELDADSKIEEDFIELRELERMRKGESFKAVSLKNAEFVARETRVGIALETDKKKAREGMIYSISYYRFRNGGFVMLTDDEKTAKLVSEIEGVFLGFRSRWASVKIEEIKTDVFDTLEKENVAVYLVTPAVFSGGGIPSSRTLAGRKILTTVGVRKLPVSGWDLQKNKPKKIYHAVSPGAVYYLGDKANENEHEESKLKDFGFGRYVFMEWKKLGEG